VLWDMLEIYVRQKSTNVLPLRVLQVRLVLTCAVDFNVIVLLAQLVPCVQILSPSACPILAIMGARASSESTHLFACTDFPLRSCLSLLTLFDMYVCFPKMQIWLFGCPLYFEY
jgi:hypothetical protein